ncbi:hypothetical protein C1141_20870 [Vibrio agarivorans]|nr:hypothetical protein C1141_20870 [Vibrio agarivorans]
MFEGERVSCSRGCPSAEHVVFRHGHNSGVGAINLAAHYGAQRIVLVGYDCSAQGERLHWHGDHPGSLGNAGSMGKWPAQFELASRQLSGINIINASRRTTLRCFPTETLEAALA